MRYNNFMQPDNDDRPVTHSYLREVLKKVDESLQQFSQSIEKLQQPKEQSSVSTDKLIRLEQRIDELHQKVQTAIRDDKSDDYDQNTLKQELQKIQMRLDQLERLEKDEEYDQNTLERDVKQLQLDHRETERKLRDIDYKLRKL